MIDPQGQAVSWIRSKESSNLPAFGVAALNDPKLRDKLEFTMGDGKALIVLGERKPSMYLEERLLTRLVCTLIVVFVRGRPERSSCFCLPSTPPPPPPSSAPSFQTSAPLEHH